MTYEEFFKEASRSFAPYTYQCKLAECPWPDLLEVPTGMGKTAAVILAWLWKRCWRKGSRSGSIDPHTPRRLVYCLPMRVLVEQTYRNAKGWLENLGILGKPGVSLHLLMGGSEDVTKASWTEHPEEDMILIGTQDMLLSAALNRAYATYPSQWPVHFGFLNVDAFWVMDEVQLMGPGRTTSVQLQHFFEHLGQQARREVPFSRRTLWMSATLGQAQGSPDWMNTPELKAAKCYSPKEEVELYQSRLQASKTVNLQLEWTSTNAELHKKILIEACQIEACQDKSRLVLVFVNTVRRAQELKKALDKALDEQLEKQSCNSGCKPEVILIHSRFRKKDRDQVVSELVVEEIKNRDQVVRKIELVVEEIKKGGGRWIVISTQVLESGVDLDADALFTEIAPWASLIQRFGRLNRKGEKQSASAVVFWAATKAAGGQRSEQRRA